MVAVLGRTGLARGVGADLLGASFDGVGILDSLTVAACPGLVFGAVLLGEPEIVLGVKVLVFVSDGLERSVDGPSCVRTE
jgi:hypothetical protein